MVSYDNLVLVGVQSPSKIKPPADCRGAQMYHVMRGMTRTSQQVRRGVLEKKAEQWGFVLLVLLFFVQQWMKNLLEYLLNNIINCGV